MYVTVNKHAVKAALWWRDEYWSCAYSLKPVFNWANVSSRS